MKRVSVVINLHGETDGVLNGLVNPKLRPAALSFPDTINTPKDRGNRMSVPRAVFYLGKYNPKPLWVTVRCISDLIQRGASVASSEEKYRALVPMLAGDKPDFVIGISTANYPSQESHNGSVVVGGNFFLHDGHSDNSTSNLKTEHADQFLPCNANPEIFKLIDRAFIERAVRNFIAPPNNPAKKLTCMASADYSAINSINVNDYREYDRVDQEALDRFREVAPNASANSIETTQGLIRISTDRPVIFFAPIVDRLSHSKEDISRLQSYVASFNCGIVLGHFLCALIDFVKDGKSFGK